MHSDKQINNPLISVIMPVYNCEKYVAEAIDSILKQTYENFELLICDDGSTDKTLEIVSYYKKTDNRIKLFINNKNLGKSTSVNSVYHSTKGKFITIHDADDMSQENRFEQQINVLKNNREMAFCGTNFYTIDQKGNIIGTSSLNHSDSTLQKELFNSSQFHGPTVVFQKQVLNQLDLIYRPFFKDYNEDYDLCFRASQFGETTNLDPPLYYYRLTRNSLSRALTPQKRCSSRLVQQLAIQRKNNNGMDDLMRGDTQNLEKFLTELTQCYRLDPSMIIREQAEHNFYYGFYSEAIKSAVRAISIRPMNVHNYKLLQHLLRKKIFKF